MGHAAACERPTRKARRVCSGAAHTLALLSLVEGSKGLYHSREAEEVYLVVARQGEAMPAELCITGLSKP